MREWQSWAKVSAQLGVCFIRHLLGWAVFGMVLNLVLFLLWRGQIAPLWQDGGVAEKAPALLFLFCVLVFPVAFFLVGQKQGLAACLHLLVSRCLPGLLEFLVRKVKLEGAANVQITSIPGSTVAQEAAEAQHEQVLQAIEASELSGLAKKMLRLVFADSKLAAALLQAKRECKLNQDSDAQLVEKAANIALTHIELESLEPGWTLPLYVLVANLGLPYIGAILLSKF